MKLSFPTAQYGCGGYCVHTERLFRKCHIEPYDKIIHELATNVNIRIPTNEVSKIVEKDLSYKIVGILYEVHTKLGGRYQEKIYQAAVEKLLQRDKISYKKGLPVDLIFEGSKIGKYFLDFLIENRIILELKAVYRFHPEHFKQVQSYLKTNNLKLGILANFKGPKLIYSRILN